MDEVNSMTQKVIVHVARDHGSKGSVIAEKLAEVLNCKVYDDSIIDDIAKQHDLDPEVLKNYDEKPRRSILYRLSQGGGSDLPEKMMQYMFEYFQHIAETEVMLKEIAGAYESHTVGKRLREGDSGKYLNG